MTRENFRNLLRMLSGYRVASCLSKPFRTRVRCGPPRFPSKKMIPRSQPEGHLSSPVDENSSQQNARKIYEKLTAYGGDSRAPAGEVSRVERAARGRLRSWGALTVAVWAGSGFLALFGGAAAPTGPVEHLRGIYLQRAVELATVGARTIHLTRFTRFRRCGRFRGTAEDFNGHLVDVAGRDVPGIGFVAGLVYTIEGCPPDIARLPETQDLLPARAGAVRRLSARGAAPARRDSTNGAAAPDRSPAAAGRTSRDRTAPRT